MENNKSDFVSSHILRICRQEYIEFFRISNVVGVGLGYKIKNGFSTNRKCIKVFVEKKIPKANLCPRDIVPSFYKNIETDIVESGTFYMNSLTKKVRPVTGGYDIGPIVNKSNGTFGCLVTDGKYYYILGSSHVLSSLNTVPIDTPIVQPSTLFEPSSSDNIVANLSKYIKTYPDPVVNIVDCAMAKVTKRSQVSTKLTFLGRIKSTATAKLDEEVQKVGSESGLTYGIITSIGSSVNINSRYGRYIFIDQITTTSMATGGDSGSILLDENMNALGLLMGSSDGDSCFNVITNALNSLRVKIVTG